MILDTQNLHSSAGIPANAEEHEGTNHSHRLDAVAPIHKSVTRNPFKKLYHWVLHWAYTPYGIWALVLDAFAESSFFPVPPDALLIALSLSRPRKAFWYALLCSVASVLGGVLGYLIGLWFMDIIGMPILDAYGFVDKFEQVAQLYNKYSGIAVAIAGFTPIPYKVFTIAAGACKINFLIFLIASILSRGARFFLVAGLMALFGEKVKAYIDKYFNLLTLIFGLLVVLGFVVVKFIVAK